MVTRKTHNRRVITSIEEEENKKTEKKEDPGRLQRHVFKTNDNVKCTFDEERTCIIHKCVAEKISVKTSRYKSGVGFVQESVSRLRCNGGQRGLESPKNTMGQTHDTLL